MKYNKGFAPVLVLIIVLGVLAVGGVAYFAGKSSAPKNEVTDNSNYFPPVQQNQNPPVTSNTKNNVTPPVTIKPSISVLLPKTGDTLVAGSVKVVTWSSTNLTSSDLINIWLIGVGNSQYSKELIHATINDGSESVTIPSQLNDQFELMVQLTNGRDNSGSSYITIIPKVISSATIQTKICSTTGISVRLPDRSTYVCEPDDNGYNGVISLYVGYFDRESMSGMSDSGGLPGIMNITKYANINVFDDIKSTNINQEYYTLIDGNYPISGTTGLYYKSKPGAFGDGEGEIAIAVPSKFIIIHIDSLDSLAKVYKMNNNLRDLLKTERDSIVKSISF